ncbi:hypothetical protein C2G38_2250572 [Gigaspora rosea]|uniref:Uncharacterized protein n=1 Tax=Gigaspora rosea TaxID=44941 RepID=A0A397UMN5_9GLOM|nr:hypothetical protein C2G38_2250572 [Gigaspora rosea]
MSLPNYLDINKVSQLCKENPTNRTRSIQIPTPKIQLDNKLDPHISVKNQISIVLRTQNTDDIWITITQGINRQINYNAEKFRKSSFRHEGKKEIVICVDDILSESTLEGDWPEAYICCFECGIPKITLEGTLEDWMKLQEKGCLEPIIWNLVTTYHGEINEDFWSRIMKIDEEFGSGEILEDSDGDSVVSPVIGWTVIDDTSTDKPDSEFYFLSFSRIIIQIPFIAYKDTSLKLS